MSKLMLYHGSLDVIEKPKFGNGKKYNDYGTGIYCTENIELASRNAPCYACPATGGQNGC